MTAGLSHPSAGNASNTSLSELADSCWDAVVIGAGVSGTITALCIAETGKRVLLVEAKSFPRDKVCGGCLNQRAWQLLERLPQCNPCTQPSLAEELSQAGAVPLSQIQLRCFDRSATWALPTMQAISRRTMDQILVERAVACGVRFLPGTSARVLHDAADEFRRVRLQTHANSSVILRAALVIAADGLGHPSLAEIPAVRTKIASNARVGLGATFAGQTDCYPAGQLTMAVGDGGYAGITQVEAGLLNVAAAVDPHALRQSGSPLNQINNILRGCKLPLIESDSEVRWTGTPALTRHSRQLSQRRLLLVGDAVSYLEPFTGEGMSWAIRSAVLASRLVNESSTMWEDTMPQRWQDQWRKHVASQQTACRTLSSLLKYPRIAKLSLLFASAVPWIPRKIMRQVSGVDESLTVEAFG